MKLVTSETVYYDYNNDREETIETVIFDSEGYGSLIDLVECFRCSLYNRVRVVADQWYTPENIRRAIHTRLKLMHIKDCRVNVKFGKVYMEKVRSAENESKTD